MVLWGDVLAGYLCSCFSLAAPSIRYPSMFRHFLLSKWTIYRSVKDFVFGENSAKANNQWNIGADLGNDPMESAFARTLTAGIKGVAMVLDQEVQPLTSDLTKCAAQELCCPKSLPKTQRLPVLRSLVSVRISPVQPSALGIGFCHQCRRCGWRCLAQTGVFVSNSSELCSQCCFYETIRVLWALPVHMLLVSSRFLVSAQLWVLITSWKKKH